MEGLSNIWADPSTRPDVMFYDRGCAIRRYLINNPDPLWAMTRFIVDR